MSSASEPAIDGARAAACVPRLRSIVRSSSERNRTYTNTPVTTNTTAIVTANAKVSRSRIGTRPNPSRPRPPHRRHPAITSATHEPTMRNPDKAPGPAVIVNPAPGTAHRSERSRSACTFASIPLPGFTHRTSSFTRSRSPLRSLRNSCRRGTAGIVRSRSAPQQLAVRLRIVHDVSSLAPVRRR